MTGLDQRKIEPDRSQEAGRRRRTKVFVVVFVLAAVLLAIYASVVFKQMIDDRELQEKLEEVRKGSQ